ncbi:MAG: DUF1343 domain-containing protein [Saprospiraceae bacterium]
MVAIKCGIDRLKIDSSKMDLHLHYGLITNESAVDDQGTPILKVLLDLEFKIKTIFSPEHGFKANGADGSFQPHGQHARLNIPIVSLYGDQLSPSEESLKQLDALILDLPNIGVRYYTYLWTMMHVMETCVAYQKPLILLDRPNPLGGDLSMSEGPMMQPASLSFIGSWNVPIRFGLTLGELALLIKKEKGWHRLDLQIIPTAHWKRYMNCAQYQYPFVPPSPAITDLDTIFTYPALCYLEATNISEGRGTEKSFKVAVAPWIHIQSLISNLEKLDIKGLRFDESVLIAKGNKCNQETCFGAKLVVTDPNLFRPVYCGMILLAMIKSLFADQFRWMPYPTHVNRTGEDHFVRLTGSTKLKHWLEHAPLENLDGLTPLLACEGWVHRCQSIMLYD